MMGLNLLSKWSIFCFISAERCTTLFPTWFMAMNWNERGISAHRSWRHAATRCHCNSRTLLTDRDSITLHLHNSPTALVRQSVDQDARIGKRVMSIQTERLRERKKRMPLRLGLCCAQWKSLKGHTSSSHSTCDWDNSIILLGNASLHGPWYRPSGQQDIRSNTEEHAVSCSVGAIPTFIRQ